MITPVAFVESAIFSAGQQYENRRICGILRYRLALVRKSAMPSCTKASLIEEIEATIRAIGEVS